MSFPNFPVWNAEDVTRARESTANVPETPEEFPGTSKRAPAVERIWEWQAGTRNGKLSFSILTSSRLTARAAIMVEKALSTKATSTPKQSMRGTAWRKLVETLRTAERKKRRVKDFDTIMRRGIDNPIAGYEETEMQTVFSDGEVHTYTAITHRPDDDSAPQGNWMVVLDRVVAEDAEVSVEDASSTEAPGSEAVEDACETMSLFSALAYTGPEDWEEEGITALPTFRPEEHEASETTRKKVLKKAKSTLY